MKTLLIQPPVRDFYRTSFRQYPLGLIYVASALRKYGHHPVLLDATRRRRSNNASLPVELSHLTTFYTPENGLPWRFRHFGMSFAKIAEAASSARPDIVCLSASFTPYVGEVLETARAVKEAVPGVPVVAGGHHATADPGSLLESGDIDHVLRGEGEEALPAFLDRGTAHTTGEAHRVADLDVLPFPARDLLEPDNYVFEKRRYAMLLTSRGCPFRCRFCSSKNVFGTTYRTRSLEGVLAEIDECIERHAISAFDLQDDNLLYEPERVKTLFEELLSRYGTRDLLWMASNGLNVTGIDEELLRLMKRIGFRKLDIALGTGNVPGRRRLMRPETVDQYEVVLEWAARVGLPVTTYVILGIPDQPLHEMKQTLEDLKTRNTLISPSVFYNVPGMPMFEQARACEYHDSHTARRSTAFNNFGIDFTREDVFSLFLEIRRHNLAVLAR